VWIVAFWRISGGTLDGLRITALLKNFEGSAERYFLGRVGGNVKGQARELESVR